MNEILRLITEIIILASAVIGIYKVATAKPEIAGVPATTSRREWPELVKGIAAYAGVYTFMLVPLVFMVIFSWLTKAMSFSFSSTKSSTGLVEMKVPEDFSKMSERGVLALRLLQVGSAVTSVSEKDEILSKAVSIGINANEPRIALSAAQQIQSVSTKDDQLLLVMRSAIKSGSLDVAVSAIQSIQSVSTKSDAGKEFTKCVENWDAYLQTHAKR